jgi:Bacterial Ig-like domain (group 3)/PKD domain
MSSHAQSKAKRASRTARDAAILRRRFSFKPRLEWLETRLTPAGTLTLVNSPATTVFGQTINFSGTADNTGGGSAATGDTIQILNGATVIGSGTITGAASPFSYNFNVTAPNLPVSGSPFTLVAHDATNSISDSAGVTQTVIRAGTTTSVTSSVNPSFSGAPVTFSATVAVIAPGAGTPTGSVIFQDNGGVLGNGTLNSGIAVFSTSSLTVGSHTITAVYGGDPNFNASNSAPLTQVVNPAIFTVTTTADSGPGSLRKAILDANASGSNAATITFNIPASDPGHVYYKDDGIAGHLTPANVTPTTAATDSSIANIDPDYAHSWWSIQVTSALPSITGATTIDGYTQSGATTNTLASGDNAVLRIEINGAGVVNGYPGLGVGIAPRLLVNDFANSDVQVYNASTGGFLSSFSLQAQGSPPKASQPSDITLGPDGKLYIGDFNNNLIERFDPVTDTFLSNFNSGDGGILNGPAGFQFGPDGNLYVASYNNAKILEYNGTTGAYISTLVSDSTHLHLTHPNGFTFGPDGNMYVSDTVANGAVLRYYGPAAPPGHNPGDFKDSFIPAGTGGLGTAIGITFGPDGNFYVADLAHDDVLRYNGTTGAPLPATGQSGAVFVPSGSGGLPKAYNLRFGPDGNLYVETGDPVLGSTTAGVWRFNGQTGAFIDTFIPLGSHGLKEADAQLFLSPQSGGPATIRGLAINRFGGPGIELESPGSNVVTGDYIGTDISGTIAQGNGFAGVLADYSASNTIGGGTPDTRNVISGNLGAGVSMQGFAASGNQVLGNMIGTDPTGQIAVANTGDGVYVVTGSKNTIGGNVTGSRNIISGNQGSGVHFVRFASQDVVEGNYIGTNSAGTAAVPNVKDGVWIQNGAQYNLIGTNGDGINDAAERNVISGNDVSGVEISDSGTSGNIVAGNYIGTDVTGTLPLGNSAGSVGNYAGVFIDNGAQDNTIGASASGDPVAERNILSGNQGDGVDIGYGASANLVAGNYIGTDVTGTIAVPNTGAQGITILSGATYNTVGGTTAAARNVISGNSANGVVIEQVGTNHNLVEGNYLGTDFTGTAALPNLNHGLLVASGASFNTIGGTAAGAGNVISGNALRGIRIRDLAGDTAAIVGTQILGNSIGVDASGNPLPNGTAGGTNIGGISILGTVVGVTGTVIGGTAPGAANIIASNDGPGITVEGALATGNTVQGNSIYGNTALGIDLGADGVTPNHTGSVAGPNNFQNYPVLIGARPADGLTEVVGTLNSLPNATYTLDFYDSPTVDPSGFGQGKRYLGSATVVTDSSGNVRFDVSSLSFSNTGDVITATATDSAGNTSEFSRFVVAGLLVTNTNDTGAGSLRQAITNADASSITLPKTIGFNIPTSDPGYNSATGTWTIRPSYVAGGVSLPVISSPVILAGWSQGGPGYNGPPLIDIDGTNAFGDAGSFGFNIQASNTQVYGFAINNFADVNGNGFGIGVFGAQTTNVWIYGNDIGTDATGMVAAPNGQGGIWVGAGPTNVLIGANANDVNAAAERNIISGNSGLEGILLQSSSTTVAGNYIGVAANGATALGNTGAGIALDGSSNTIGGTSAAARNVISGNTASGVAFISSTNNNVVAGNYIGTDATGLAPLGNHNGISVSGVNNTIGGTTAGAGNLISGDTNDDGILLGGIGTVVQGNLIGTDKTGAAPLGNFKGIQIFGNGPGVVIGGTTAAARNIISGNTADGIAVEGDSNGAGLAIVGNYIGTDSSGQHTLSGLPQLEGVALYQSTGVTVGGLTAGQGNLISGNRSDQVRISSPTSTGNQVAGNLIGTDYTGNAALVEGTSASVAGVYIYGGASGNTIGGNFPGAGNTISDNAGDGVLISNSGTSNNVVARNMIGTNSTGGVALPNQSDGVAVASSANNTIGGSVFGAGNVISGNQGSGVDLLGGATGNVVQGNDIGTNAAGTGQVANQGNGVWIQNGAQFNIIGANPNGVVDTLEQNIISGNAQAGVQIQDSGTSQNVIAGNYIGTDKNGAAALANLNNGVVIVNGASGNTVGGTATADRNVISGNQSDGIVFAAIGLPASGNSVEGNFIGTDATGSFAVPNKFTGITANTAGNTIGGSVAGAGNLISGNGTSGVNIATGGDITVQGNLIGTDSTGTKALPDSGGHPLGNGYGVFIAQAAQPSLVGSDGSGLADAFERNVISGNGTAGVVLIGASHNTVAGNYIGTDITGVLPVGNGYSTGFASGAGVILLQDFQSVPAPAQFNQIGGLGDLANTIAFNFGPGVSVTDNTSIGNSIRGNSIHDNFDTAHNKNYLGIDLGGSIFTGPDGVTPNHFGFTVGPNNFQNYPVLSFASTQASTATTSTTVQGTLNAISNNTYTIDFYANAQADPSGHGEGQRYLGSTTVTTNNSGPHPLEGNASFTVTNLGKTSPGEEISATATALDGSTSEFSADVPVLAASAGGPYTINEGQSLMLDASASSGPPNATLTYSWDINGDGVYGDATGVQPTLTWAQLNALGIKDATTPFSVTVQVSDGLGHTVTSPATTLTVVNVPPSNLALTLSNSTISQGGSVTLGGSFADPGQLDTHTAVINWGDGSAPTTVPLAAGVLTFAASHPYLSSLPSNAPFTIGASVADGEPSSTPATATTQVTVTSTSNVQVSLTSSSINENDSTTLNGSFTDPNTSHTHTVVVDWGDGSQPTTLNLVAGLTSFSAPHQYLNNAVNTSSSTDLIKVTVTDSGGGNAPRLFVNDFSNNGTGDFQVYNLTNGGFLGSFGSGTLKGPSDIVLGPDGKLYVGSFLQNQIDQFDPATGAFLGVFASGGGLNGPAGMVFGPDGNLYVNSWYNASVIEYNGTTGAPIRTFISDTTNLHNPLDLVFGPDGNLYVSDSVQNGAVLRYNGTTGAFMGTFVQPNSGGLAEPMGITFGPDGNFYIASLQNAEVLRYDGQTGAFKNVFVSTGGGVPQGVPPLPVVEDLEFRPDGRLYVASGDSVHGSQVGGVYRFDATTGAFVDQFIPLGSNGLQVADALAFVPSQSESILVTVSNVPPVIHDSDLNVSQTSFNEGANTTLSGSFTDPGTQDTHTVTINWGDGQPATVIPLQPSVYTFSTTHSYVDAPQTGNQYPITVTVTDDDGATGTAHAAATVNDATPTLTVNGSTDGVIGQARTFTLSPSDPSPVDQAGNFTYTVNWGDGVGNSPDIQTYTGPAGLQVAHTYASTGAFNLAFTATDDGGMSNVVTPSITIAAAQLQTQHDQTFLAVGSTPTTNGQITVTQNTNAGTLSVSSDGNTSSFSSSGVTQVQVFSTAGNTVNTMAVTTVPVNITVPQGDQTIDGGNSGTTANLNVGSTVSISVTGGENTLNFAPTQFGITFNPNMNTGQMQQLDSSGKHFVAITGTFQNVVGTGKNDTLFAPDPVVQGPVTLQSFDASHTTLTESGGNNTLYAAPMSTITVAQGSSALYVGLPTGVSAPNLSTLFNAINTLVGQNPANAGTLFQALGTTINLGSSSSNVFAGPMTTVNGGINSTMYVGLPSGLTAPDLQTLFQGITSLAGKIDAQTLFDGVRTTFNPGPGGTNTMYTGPVSGFVGGANSNNTMYVGLPSGMTAPDLQTLFQGISQLAGSNISASTLFDGVRMTFTGGSGGTNTMFSGPVSGFVGGANSSNTMYVGLPSGVTAPNLQTLFQGIQQLAGSNISASTLFDGVRPTFTGGSGGTNTMFTGPVSGFVGGANSNNTMYVGLPSGVTAPNLQTLFQGIQQLAGSNISASTLFDGVRPTFTGGSGGTNTMFSGPVSGFVGGANSNNTMYVGLPSGVTAPNLQTLFQGIQQLAGSNISASTLFDGVRPTFTGGSGGSNTMFSGPVSGFVGGANSSNTMYVGLPTGVAAPDLQTLFQGIGQLAGSNISASTLFDGVRATFTGGSGGTNTMFSGPVSGFVGGANSSNTMYVGLPAGVAAPDLQTLFQGISQLAGSNISASTLFDGVRATFTGGSGGTNTMFSGPVSGFVGGANSSNTMYVGLPSGLTAPDLQILFQGIQQLAGSGAIASSTLFDGVRATFTGGSGGTNTMFTGPVSSFVGGDNSNNTMFVGLPSGVSAPDLQTLFQGMNQFVGNTISANSLFDGVRPTFTGGNGGTDTMYTGVMGTYVGNGGTGTLYAGLPQLIPYTNIPLVGVGLPLLFSEIAALIHLGGDPYTLFSDLVINLNGGPNGDLFYAATLSQAQGGAGNDVMYAALPAGFVGPDPQALQAEINTLVASYGANGAALQALLTPVLNGGGGDNVLFGAPGAILQAGGPGDNTLYAAVPTVNDSMIQLPVPTQPTTLVGGTGNDTFVFTGLNLGHIYVTENNETGNNTLDFTNYGGPITVDTAQTTDQTVNPGNLVLTLSDARGIANVIGTRFADTIYANSRTGTVSAGHFLDDRASQPTPPPNNGTQVVFLDFDTATNVFLQHIYTPAERQGILAGLQTMYAAFPWVQFTLTKPTSGNYITEFFNQISAQEAPGGQSDQIDFGDVAHNGVSYVNLNGIIGVPGTPAATSQDYINFSVTIGGHELGHELGLQHVDAFGPIGMGIHNPPGAGQYNPVDQTPAAAFESTFHTISSPASDGSTLAQAVGMPAPFFGEREDVHLAFDHDGTWYNNAAIVNDTVTPHGSQANALPLTLTPLAVPNTETNGIDVGKTFAVAASAVNGYIGIDTGSGHSAFDYYSFTGRAGDVLNFEVMSNALKRITDPIDAVVSVYDSSGQLVPYYGGTALNAGVFESNDAALYDVKLPANGTYYVKVNTIAFAPPGLNYAANTPAGSTTATGHYVLFLFRFDAAFTQQAGDTLVARAGNTTLVGGPGNDTFVVGSGQQTIIGGGGQDTIQASGAASYVLTNTSLTGAGTATFQGISNAVLTGGAGGTLFNLAGWSGSATITGVSGSNTLIGPYGPNIWTSTGPGAGNINGTIAFTGIQNITPVLTSIQLTSSTITEGGSATLTVNFTDRGIVDPQQVTITWGDNTSDTFSVSGSALSFTRNHMYNEERPAPYAIGIRFVAPDNAVTTGSTSVLVKDPTPVVNSITGPTSIIPGQSVTLSAAFTDAGFLDTHTAVWNWGDSTSTTATVVESNGSGTATASHVYATTGPYTATVTVSDDDGTSGTGTFLVNVSQFIYVLNPTAGGAFTASGNAAVKLPGAVLIDSSSPTALSASGNASITSPSIRIVGGFSKTGNASFSVTPQTGITPFTDPLAGLTAPNPTALGLTNKGSINLSGNGSQMISQGIYTQINVSGNAHLTLNPGVYVIQGGGFTVSGNASVAGNGVLIYNAGSNFPSAGGNFGGITLSGNGTITLTPPTTGQYDGVVIYQSRENTRALSLGGNASAGITGDVYAANALLSLSGNTQLKAPLVVGTVNVSGNVSLTQIAAGSDGGDTTGIANTLLAGNLSVYINDPNHYFTSDELARIQDTINGLNALLAPFSVTISEVSDPSAANLVLDVGTTSASGGAANGVLGCFNPAASEITLITGWNWYAGADATQIGANQYDFQTTVTHEFGHALGLGGATDLNSPMFETLATGTAHRTMRVSDLNIPYPPDGADPLTAAGHGFVSVAAVGAMADLQSFRPVEHTPFTVVQHDPTLFGGDLVARAARLEAIDAVLTGDRRSAYDAASPTVFGVASPASAREWAPVLPSDDSPSADISDGDLVWSANDAGGKNWRIEASRNGDSSSALPRSAFETTIFDLLMEAAGEDRFKLPAVDGEIIDLGSFSATASLDSAFVALGFYSAASAFGAADRDNRPASPWDRRRLAK